MTEWLNVQSKKKNLTKIKWALKWIFKDWKSSKEKL